jgi:hypothetical protein
MDLLNHIRWMNDTGERLTTTEGKVVEVWELCHEQEEQILSSWAKHFRNHYSLDDEIDFYRRGLGCSREEYLNRIKFPDPSIAPGPSIRAGDFGEILVADYLQYILEYWVPRTRYGNKTIRNESTKGCDILGFKIINKRQYSPEDTLAIYEAKTQFSGVISSPRLQDAVDGSAKDCIREAESLNAIKQRLYESRKFKQSILIERFQDIEDRPFKRINGAVALFSTHLLNRGNILNTKVSAHPNASNIKLLVIHGNLMMDLVHGLYRRAANEA